MLRHAFYRPCIAGAFTLDSANLEEKKIVVFSLACAHFEICQMRFSGYLLCMSVKISHRMYQ